MKKLVILYFSATGGTRVAAELLTELLIRNSDCSDPENPAISVQLVAIEESGAKEKALAADFLLFCFPTYYLKPAQPMLEFVLGLGRARNALPCYLIVTCELYSENCARRLAKTLASQGFIVTGAGVLRAPGSDVTAVLPAFMVPWLYRYERGFEEKLSRLSREIKGLVTKVPPIERLPRARWYTLFTQLLQIIALNHFDGWRYRLRVLREHCSLCGRCASYCPSASLRMTTAEVQINADSCLLCCRCIHACASRAIVLRGRLQDNKRIDPRLLGELKEQARRKLGLSFPQLKPTVEEVRV